MIRMFEGIALVAAGGLVSGLVAVAVLNPPDIATGTPHAVFAFLKSQQHCISWVENIELSVQSSIIKSCNILHKI